MGGSVFTAVAKAFTRITMVSSVKKWRGPEVLEEVGSALTV
jgi:hypothetical protein